MSDLSHVDSLRVMTTSIAEGADQGKLSIGISGAGDERRREELRKASSVLHRETVGSRTAGA